MSEVDGRTDRGRHPYGRQCSCRGFPGAQRGYASASHIYRGDSLEKRVDTAMARKTRIACQSNKVKGGQGGDPAEGWGAPDRYEWKEGRQLGPQRAIGY